MNRFQSIPEKRRLLYYGLLALSGWATWALTFLPPAAPVRVGAVFTFTLVGPGLAFAAPLTRDPLLRAILAVTLSLAICLLVSVGATIARDGSTSLRMVVVAGITTFGALIGAVRAARPRTPDDTSSMSVTQ